MAFDQYFTILTIDLDVLYESEKMEIKVLKETKSCRSFINAESKKVFIVFSL